MKRVGIKEKTQIISSNGFVWTIEKKYAKDWLLIRQDVSGKLVCLSGGQFRMFKTKEEVSDEFRRTKKRICDTR